MNNEQTQKLMDRYGSGLSERENVILSIETGVALKHLQAMAILASAELFDEGKMQRWLGFMQGVLWAYGVRGIEELKQDVREAKNSGKEVRQEASEGNVLEMWRK